MTLTIELSPTDEESLAAVARREGIGMAALAQKFVVDRLRKKSAARFHDAPAIDPQNAAAIALLRSWREQDATDDPDEIRQAEQELAEFKQNLNANRAATGEELLHRATNAA